MVGATLALMTMVVAALVRRRATEPAQDRRRAGRDRRRGDRARGRPCGRAAGRVARRPHDARRHLLLGLLQCLVAPVHRALVAADLPYRRNGSAARPAWSRLALARGGFDGRRGVRSGAMDRGRVSGDASAARWRSSSGSSRSSARPRPAWRAPSRSIRSAPRSSRRSSSASRSGSISRSAWSRSSPALSPSRRERRKACRKAGSCVTASACLIAVLSSSLRRHGRRGHALRRRTPSIRSRSRRSASASAFVLLAAASPSCCAARCRAGATGSASGCSACCSSRCSSCSTTSRWLHHRGARRARALDPAAL